MEGEGNPSGPLAGLRIVDLTQVLAGPFCSMLLADLGADVIKVEPPEGDPTRGWGPFRSDDQRRAFGGYFASINRNKRSLCLNLKCPEGRDVLFDVLAKADVLVENFRVGVTDRLGLGYDVVHERFPSLVYASISGFGSWRTGDSPYRDWPAFDIVAQAMGGLLGITGELGGEPLKAGPGIGDIYPATLAAVGVLAAVRHASITGTGTFIDVAMYDGVLALCERIIYQYSYTGEDPVPQGNTHPFLCPYGLFPTADGWVTIAAPTDRLWRLLTVAMGRGELGEAAAFATNTARVENMAEVGRVVGQWTRSKTSAAVVAALGGTVPCGPVNQAADILSDPHVVARDMVIEVEHPGTSSVSLVGSPIKFAGLPFPAPRRARLLGEDSVEILRGVGYQSQRIDELVTAGVVVPDDAVLPGVRGDSR